MKNIFVSLSFFATMAAAVFAVAGQGPIWRVRDANNYYIARFNPLENNFRVYYVKDEARRQLDSKNIKLSPSAWHTIKIVHKGNRIEAHLNGKKLLECNDSTFLEAGGVGVWTKADASTYFDDFRIISEAVSLTNIK